MLPVESLVLEDMEPLKSNTGSEFQNQRIAEILVCGVNVLHIPRHVKPRRNRIAVIGFQTIFVAEVNDGIDGTFTLISDLAPLAGALRSPANGAQPREALLKPAASKRCKI